MTKEVYCSSGCEGKICVFKLSNGVDITGIISNFFPLEPDNYYYINCANISTFNFFNYKERYAAMKSLCISVDLAYIVSAERSDPYVQSE